MKVPHPLRRDDTIVPAICYDTCNNAYFEAQSMGKKPELCDPRSAFRNYYDACQACVAANAADVRLVTKGYLDPTFKQFLDYCANIGPTDTVPVNSASLASQWKTASTQTQRSMITLPADYFTYFVDTISLTTTFPDGYITAVPITRTYSYPDPKYFNFTTPATTSGALAPTPTVPAEATASPSNAWIAGPVIGAVVAISVLIFAGYFFFHIRPKRSAAAAPVDQGGEEKGPLEKAQLHSDSISRPPQEMDGGMNSQPTMVANEGPAVELPAESLRR
ncbi:hypothetical protein B0T16DRAFT_456015 [Cercophora newfieldiana]|uniref:Uncharacterized protein n=1 Tax=Cercophora newfieldiana TaxID=92897 RepID=A0AA40CRB6_9PEZI|nr:hypothetical protein B0T16DRAFT_456015 [Cercophora newfieldiana]